MSISQFESRQWAILMSRNRKEVPASHQARFQNASKQFQTVEGEERRYMLADKKHETTTWVLISR
jgi:hypothetical protein